MGKVDKADFIGLLSRGMQVRVLPGAPMISRGQLVMANPFCFSGQHGWSTPWSTFEPEVWVEGRSGRVNLVIAWRF